MSFEFSLFSILLSFFSDFVFIMARAGTRGAFFSAARYIPGSVHFRSAGFRFRLLYLYFPSSPEALAGVAWILFGRGREVRTGEDSPLFLPDKFPSVDCLSFLVFLWGDSGVTACFPPFSAGGAEFWLRPFEEFFFLWRWSFFFLTPMSCSIRRPFVPMFVSLPPLLPVSSRL